MELSPTLYHHLIRPDWFFKRYVHNTIKDNIDFQNKKVIDFGCGIGSCSVLFDPSCYIGMDCDAKRIEYAKMTNPEYEFNNLEGNALPVPDSSVDYILIVSVLHHIASKDISQYLNEFRRVLNSSGKIFVIEPCFFKGSYLSNSCMSWLDRGKHIRSEEEYIDIFLHLGYDTRIIKRFNQLLLYKKLFFVAAPV